MKILVVLNDPPYGTERSYNGLRLAGALSKRDGVEVRVFLFGDAVGCAIRNQKVPDGYYHLDRMVTAVVRHGGEIGCCDVFLGGAATEREPHRAEGNFRGDAHGEERRVRCVLAGVAGGPGGGRKAGDPGEEVGAEDAGERDEQRVR